MYRVLIASLSVAALMLATSTTFARSGAAGPGGAMASMRPGVRPALAPSFRHHRRNFVGTFWPGEFYDGAPYGEPQPNVSPPASNDVHVTTTYDVPWDWAHRYPPQVTPSDHPYVSSCPVEVVKLTGRDGREQTVNVMRCY
jgi:hypothetical protein